MILDCPHTWNCCTLQTTIMLNINGPVLRNQSHSLKIFSAFLTTSNTRKNSSTGVGVWKPVHSWGLKYLRRFREILFPKVSCSSPVIFSSHGWFWRHKPSWCPPVALLFVLELLPIHTTDEFVVKPSKKKDLNSRCLFSKYSFLAAAMSRSPSSRALWSVLQENIIFSLSKTQPYVWPVSTVSGS